MLPWRRSKQPPKPVVVPRQATAGATSVTHVIVDRSPQVVVVDDGPDDFVTGMIVGEMIQSAVDLVADVASSFDTFDAGGGSFGGGGDSGGW